MKAIGYLIYNFWFFIYFIFSGFVSLFHKNRKLSIILFVSILFNLGFTVNKKSTSDEIRWMMRDADEYINLVKPRRIVFELIKAEFLLF
ncbi:MAG: hypothetical protein LBE36_00805 [Flavobacteriaceae bacterium]|nr:hypothetical protein [Flavobacteriaceae bacterium]